MTSSAPIPPPFDAAVGPIAGGARVRFDGELDLATVGAAEAAVAAARREHGGRLELDLSGLTFLDSSGLRLIVQINAAADDLTIVPGPPSVQRVFELAGVLDILPFR